MMGAPARAIQGLAGDADLVTTQRYMHLSPVATEDAIPLLEYGSHGPAKAGHYGSDGVDRSENNGDILDTRNAPNGRTCERRSLWSGLRGSNPCPRLGKPLYYHCTKPAELDARSGESIRWWLGEFNHHTSNSPTRNYIKPVSGIEPRRACVPSARWSSPPG